MHDQELHQLQHMAIQAWPMHLGGGWTASGATLVTLLLWWTAYLCQVLDCGGSILSIALSFTVWLSTCVLPLIITVVTGRSAGGDMLQLLQLWLQPSHTDCGAQPDPQSRI
jgi:hypothetical protein